MSDSAQHTEEQVSDKIFTVPNLISFIRLMMAPAFLVLLFQGNDLAAAIVFGIAASTDWVDGQIARRTNQVSRLGQLLDPAVDRILMITGVLGVFLVGRLPLWMILLVLVRDLTLLLGGYHLLRKYKIRVPVVYVGKVATTFLYIGFAGLILNMPLLAGLGYVDYSWLPLFNHDMYSWGFWFIYAGLFCAIISTSHYIYSAMKQRREVLERSSGEAGDR